jgi:prepilin-type N-terminal cleavage/methylation domain-containing protein
MEREKGFSLIEVMLAIALLGIIAVAFLGALATGSKAIIIADERATAESLARSQMEYVKNQPYILGATEYDIDPNLTLPDGYAVEIMAEPIDPVTGEALVNPSDDKGIQKITITVEHLGRPIITSGNYTLEDYKVNR